MDLGEPIAKLNPLFISKFRHKTKFIFQWAKPKPNNLSLSYTYTWPFKPVYMLSGILNGWIPGTIYFFFSFPQISDQSVYRNHQKHIWFSLYTKYNFKLHNIIFKKFNDNNAFTSVLPINIKISCTLRINANRRQRKKIHAFFLHYFDENSHQRD